MKALMSLVLVLFLAGCAAGQGGAGRTPSEGTAANGTDETTAHKEETTILEEEGNLPRPPDSTLSYGGQEVKGLLGTYCWFSGGSGACADAPFPITPPRKKTLTVPTGSEMVFRYGGQSPPDTVNAGAVSLDKKGQPRPPSSQKKGQPRTPEPYSGPSGPPLEAHGSGVERTIPVELPPAEYVVYVDLKVQKDDASYFFRIMVE
jgi:hypothetical protein